MSLSVILLKHSQNILQLFNWSNYNFQHMIIYRYFFLKFQKYLSGWGRFQTQCGYHQKSKMDSNLTSKKQLKITLYLLKVTGRAWLIRTDSSASFSFEIGGIRINSVF